MPDGNEPMIKLDPGGKAPILSYNVPEPTSYSGRFILELQFEDSDFTEAARKTDPLPERQGAVRYKVQESPRDVQMATMISAQAEPAVVNAPRPLAPPGPIPEVKGSDALDVEDKLAQGYYLAKYRDFYGDWGARPVPSPVKPRPRILLVEVYRLSSYLGAYGAGRVIKTFSLLPGEKTKISVKTYTKTSSEQKEASSILDSFTKESAADFESATQQENSNKESSQDNFDYHVDAEVSASWGFGSAKVSGGVKGGSASQREEFSKNISNATQKNASKASAKRDVQVNTSYEVKTESGEETSMERVIENVNLSRTLNFVFRQMNQEFITILHLVDVRVAFFNGYKTSAREVTLPELDSFIDEFIVADKRDDVRTAIRTQIEQVRDWRDKPTDFIEEVAFGGGDKYLRVKKELPFLYQDATSGTEIAIQGIPLAIDKHIMRTEGIIVEAMLGQAEALDGYARQLQDVEVMRRGAEAKRLAAEADRAKLINDVVTAKDDQAAKVLAEIIMQPNGASNPAPSPHA